MSAENQSTALRQVRLHRTTSGYFIAATHLLIIRPRPWTLLTHHPDSRNWISRNNLTDATFATLDELRRSITPYLHNDPPPAFAPLPRLHTTDDGYRTPDSTYILNRLPMMGRTWWQIMHDDAAIGLCDSLIRARHAIAARQASTP